MAPNTDLMYFFTSLDTSNKPVLVAYISSFRAMRLLPRSVLAWLLWVLALPIDSIKASRVVVCSSVSLGLYDGSLFRIDTRFLKCSRILM